MCSWVGPNIFWERRKKMADDTCQGTSSHSVGIFTFARITESRFRWKGKSWMRRKREDEWEWNAKKKKVIKRKRNKNKA